ncbi:MAG: hypothetical protein COW19_08805 [Zetaproteobacteria bacterium CG12_big_fil_rev_8_21_14_0_65_55_1124]|nr:MAG: hypothetical protein AUJ58_03090 [Zetaproteobacteria bacterium CG1_02_55_237]PIS19458.1 MAG: hypothetical protein COT53_05410 [Zetaproteobacteria bacterium CG08_land_8_20_14_0_20_55_17]PIW42289.1 MAG: hypothetical protein COW19_08805 [Zetaproteobacteria bacterium CG12_big_fil_rev_8_21_14_0_65_55_1124]PIY52526.1 MAG: hypothetical protein COZ01_07280 [Zetaproteobacteria bacterium CG_4_10_14_0_8_um_filter_55_43]PIZ36900.1 MAG: hypothetical protein COY36_10690 [Zetaproteobacteria bacterium 
MTLMIERCPVGCDSTIEESDIALPEGRLRRCSTCGQLFSACTVERYEHSMQEFDDEQGTFVAPESVLRQKKRIGRILKNGVKQFRNPPSRISMLDVGCSSGSVLNIAREMGFDVHGVEPAPKAAATATDNGFDVFNGFLHEAEFPAESFDLVSLFEVIEHLKHPLELANEVHRILRPGGVWLIGTGNADSWTADCEKETWEYFDIDLHGGHISFFNPASISLFAERSGFEVAHIEARRVRLVEKQHAGRLAYQASKLACEFLEIPARLLNKGHDLQVVLRRRG